MFEKNSHLYSFLSIDRDKEKKKFLQPLKWEYIFIKCSSDWLKYSMTENVKDTINIKRAIFHFNPFNVTNISIADRHLSFFLSKTIRHYIFYAIDGCFQQLFTCVRQILEGDDVTRSFWCYSPFSPTNSIRIIERMHTSSPIKQSIEINTLLNRHSHPVILFNVQVFRKKTSKEKYKSFSDT